MKKQLLSFVLLIVISFVASCKTKEEYPKEDLKIKIGEVDLTIELDSAYWNDYADASVRVEIPAIFSIFAEDNVYYLKKIDGKPGFFKGKIRTDVTLKFGVAVVENKGKGFVGGVVLRQGKPLNIKITPKDDKEIPFEFKGTDENDTFDPHDCIPLLNTYLVDYQDFWNEYSSGYPGWKQLLDYQQNTLWPEVLEKSSQSCKIKPWVLNDMKMLFSSANLLKHKENVKNFYNEEGEEPPVEAYTFLNEIDYSDIMLMQMPSYNMLRSFLNRFLALESFGIPAIGDTDIEEWRDKAQTQLKKVIDNPTPLMLDLMAAISYFRQIEIDGKPLTDVQRGNIASYYKDDIGKLVLEADSAMRKTDMQNLYDNKSGERINLEEYIAERYSGKPVVVDCWESWCGPCLRAILELRERKLHEKYPDVVFLYVCSTSSEERALRKYIPMIHGEHLKIDRKTTGADLYDQYEKTGVPFYIFFNSDHKIVDKMVGFPGAERYEALLKQISSAQS